MSNVLAFPDRSGKIPQGPVVASWELIASYGAAGPISVAVARRTDEPQGLVHVVVLGSSCWVGVEPVASLPDDAGGRAAADLMAAAVLRGIEHAEVEFAAAPEAC